MTGSKTKATRGLGIAATLALAASAVVAGDALALPVHYFVVAENPSAIDPCYKCDSYILPLSDPEDVADAREIIERGGTGLGTIVTAIIAAGSDGINRDVLAPGEPLWSWRVKAFTGFAEITIEILDGWPSFVESDVEGWIRNTGGGIGFWAYTVVAELPDPGSISVDYFVVAENPSLVDPCVACDSFILPLSDPEDIAYARELIADGGIGPRGSIVFARVMSGSDGINRDVVAPGEPLWSWRIAGLGFVGYSDLPIDTVDGSPSLVESDVDGWIQRTGGYIGFSNYTVVAELPEPGAPLLDIAAIAALLGLRCRARAATRRAANRVEL
jgi:hypothetical protein